MKYPDYAPVEQTEAAVVACTFHVKGCCFDPKKSIEGYFAAPCFACKGQ